MASDASATPSEETFIAQARSFLERLDTLIDDSGWRDQHQLVRSSTECRTSEQALKHGETQQPSEEATPSVMMVLEALRQVRNHLESVVHNGALSLPSASKSTGVDRDRDLAFGTELEVSTALVQSLQRELRARTEALERWRVRAIESERVRKAFEERYARLRRTWEAAQEQWEQERLAYRQQLARFEHSAVERKRSRAETGHDVSNKGGALNEVAKVGLKTPTEAIAPQQVLSETCSSEDLAPGRERSELVQQLHQLQKEREELMTALARSEEWLGRGSFDTTRFRLWHPREAPPGSRPSTSQASKRDTEQNSLESTLTPASADRSERSQMDPWKLVQRTREAARTKILQVVESIYYLFGWRMRIAGSTYTLESLYAEHADDKIQFQRNEQGGFELISTDFVQRVLQLEVDTLLRKMDSIPAFLATVQLQLFEQSTAVTGTGPG